MFIGMLLASNENPDYIQSRLRNLNSGDDSSVSAHVFESTTEKKNHDYFKPNEVKLLNNVILPNGRRNHLHIRGVHLASTET